MSARITYNTPGRECAHAESGCCPSCFDPMQSEITKAVRAALWQRRRELTHWRIEK